MAQEAGWIASELPLSELRKKFHVNPHVENLEENEDFSQALRRAFGPEPGE